MNCLLFANNDKYANILLNYFGTGKVISDLTQYNTVAGNLSEFDIIFSVCELTWIDVNYFEEQSLPGIALIKELRLKYNLLQPVIFLSFQSLENIFSAKNEIIQTIGHEFCQLPITLQQLEAVLSERLSRHGKLLRLSNLEADDIKSFYCNKEGLVEHELHRLHHYLNHPITAANQQQVYSDLVQTISTIHTAYLSDAYVDRAGFNQLYNPLNEENLRQAIAFINQIGRAFIENGLAVQKKHDRLNVAFDHPWRVLLVDDEINYDHKFVKYLKANGIPIICTNNGESAKLILQQDWASTNTIMVLIADYRLYELVDGIKRHQRLQGYQLLKEIAASEQMVRLIAFSGMPRKFLLNSFRSYNIRTDVKSKIDYLSSERAYQQFCDELSNIAEENWNAVESLPGKCAGFAKNLMPAYKQFRLDVDYELIEDQITQAASKYVAQIVYQFNESTYVNISGIDYIRSTFSNKKDTTRQSRFKNFFIARRVALWLYATGKIRPTLNITVRKIAEILTGHVYTTNAYRQVISSNLGLSFDDFPHNITIEERRWLQYDMSINISVGIDLTDDSFKIMASFFKESIKTAPQYTDLVSKSDYTIKYRYKNTIYTVNFKKDFSPAIKTSTDLRVCYLWFESLVNKSPSDTIVLLELSGRIRYELLKKIGIGHPFKQLFRYFNAIFGELSNKILVRENPAKKLKGKTELVESSNKNINKLFDRVFISLKENWEITSKEGADFMLLYAIGFEVKYQFGELTESNKQTFLDQMIILYNNEFYSKHTSLDQINLRPSKSLFEDEDY